MKIEQTIVEEIYRKAYPKSQEGDAAHYIPELSKVNNNALGVYLHTLDGQSFGIGDYMTKFTIQSISKPLALLLALQDNDEDYVFSKVGKEPTGDPFNSMVRLETYTLKKPLNPMINAGAITVDSLIKGETYEEKFERIIGFIRYLADNDDIQMNEKVYESEKGTGNRNKSLGYFLKDINCLMGDVEAVLDLYFRQCAIEITAKDLGVIGALLANDGVDPVSGEQKIPKRYAKITKALMTTCGMYDHSGSFAIEAGFPAKSGVGGGILAAVPKTLGVGIYGPAIDSKGNSVAGMEILRLLSNEYDLSIY